MFTSITKTAICSLLITVVLAASAQAQLSNVFGSNSGGNSQGGTTQQQPNRQGGGSSTPAPTSPNIVGQWHLISDVQGGTLEARFKFSADFTLEVAMVVIKQGTQPKTNKFSGRYRLDGNNLQINYDDGDVENYLVRQNGNSLKLETPNHHSVMSFTRVENSGGHQSGNDHPRDQQRQRQDRQQNPYVGHWVLSAHGNGTTIQGTLNLNANGSYQLSMTVQEPGGTNQTALSGQWRVENNMFVFITDGEQERYPMQFDGQRLGLDLADWGVRAVFARNAQDSYVEPLTNNMAPQGDYEQGGHQSNSQNRQYQGGRPYSGNMANRW